MWTRMSKRLPWIWRDALLTTAPVFLNAHQKGKSNCSHSSVAISFLFTRHLILWVFSKGISGACELYPTLTAEHVLTTSCKNAAGAYVIHSYDLGKLQIKIKPTLKQRLSLYSLAYYFLQDNCVGNEYVTLTQSLFLSWCLLQSSQQWLFGLRKWQTFNYRWFADKISDIICP